MFHQMIVMTQNITWCDLKNQAVVRCAKRNPNAAEVRFALSFGCFLVGYLIPLIFELI